MILIVVKFPVRPERADEWSALAADYARAVNAEEGSLFFEWSQEPRGAGHLRLRRGLPRRRRRRRARGAPTHFKRLRRAGARPRRRAAADHLRRRPDVPGWGPMGEIQPRG